MSSFFPRPFHNLVDHCSIPPINILNGDRINQTKEPMACRTPVEPGTWPLNPIQYPGLTVSFRTFTFVLIDLLSPVKWQAYRVPGGQGATLQGPRWSMGRPTGQQGVNGQAHMYSVHIFALTSFFAGLKSSEPKLHATLSPENFIPHAFW